MGAFVPIMMMCQLGDRLRDQAAAGDAKAIQILIALAPKDLPPAAVRAWRDVEIRRLANWIVGRLPGCSSTKTSELLALAGELLAVRGRALGNHPAFASLTREERTKLEGDVLTILRVAPRWPSARQIRNILTR